MESVLLLIKHLYHEMGPAEKKIADQLVNNSKEIVGMSISDLAICCECGEATIVRFARRLGLGGYQELKIRIAAEMGASSSIEKEIQREDSCFQIFQKRCFAISDALSKTESVLEPEKLDQVAHLIMNATRTVIFGLGNSASIAQDAAHKLIRLGLDAQSCSDNHLQAIIASHLRRGSVAIGISHSGASKDPVDAGGRCFRGGNGCRPLDEVHIPGCRLGQRNGKDGLHPVDYVLAEHQRNAGTGFQGFLLHQAQVLNVTAAVQGAHFSFTDGLQVGVVVTQFHAGEGAGHGMQVKLAYLLFQGHPGHEVIYIAVHGGLGGASCQQAHRYNKECGFSHSTKVLIIFVGAQGTMNQFVEL